MTHHVTSSIHIKHCFNQFNNIINTTFTILHICTKLISRHYNNRLASYFEIVKTQELVARKYYWPSLWHNVKVYVKGCNLCLASKVVRLKPYDNLQVLPVPTHQ